MKRSANSTRVLLGLACVALAFSIDQLSKFVIVEIVMQPPRDIYITGFLNIVLSYNTGISFGILSGYFSDSPTSLSFLTSVVVGFLFVWMLYAKTNGHTMALGLITGGAIGNIYDRMRQGAVTDFIDLHLGAWHWPTFNTADIAIVVGAAILIADSFHSAPRQPAG
ncbi:signal peptidase II [Aquibium oceanicum]|uniref:signal peptidase II n=1 Tax=Aquibium oceanicum TaxID=1670800 RepID=UPI0009FA3199|nr:signal peptidase II [Aquibium oceanicum]